MARGVVQSARKQNAPRRHEEHEEEMNAIRATVVRRIECAYRLEADNQPSLPGRLQSAMKGHPVWPFAHTLSDCHNLPAAKLDTYSC
jgi:hypothetical protein